jgi:hypothetical protein
MQEINASTDHGIICNVFVFSLQIVYMMIDGAQLFNAKEIIATVLPSEM